MKFFIKFREE